MDRQQLIVLAHQLGHTNLAMHTNETGTKYFVTCDCGWKSTNRLTEVNALQAGVHHALTSAERWARTQQANGGTITRMAAVSQPEKVRPAS